MAYKKKIKERQDVSTLIETLVPEFITADHPKMKLFIEKYYEFMESHQVYFEGIAFNEYKLVQEGIDDASIEPDYWIFEDEINNELMPDGNKNIHFDTRVLEGAVVNHRIQLETERDTTKDDELSFIIGETVYGNTTDAEAVVTGINGKNTAYLKPTTNTNFTYGEELTGVDSRAWTTFANGVLAGVFPDGSVEGFRTRGPIAATKELSEFADIDRTIEGLIDSSWKPEFYSHVPKQAATDRRMLLKQMKEVYRSKGGEASYDWLFRAIFASQEVDYYYPKDDMIRLSDGKWTKDKTVKILTDTANNIGIFEGREIRGHSSNATAIVEKTITKMVGPVQVTELYLSKITKGVGRDGTLGYFTKHERVESAPNANNETGLGDCTGIIEEVTIEYGGSNYVVGDVVQFIGGGGADARAEVVDTVDDILYGFRIVDSGDGYFVGDKLDFIDGGTGGEGAAATVGTIIATGKAQKNDNAVQGIKTETVSSNNINKALFSNSSFRFTAGIKENSGAVFDVSGPFFTSQFFQVGDLIRRQATLESTRVFTETGIGITLTQSGTTITLSGPITVDETKLIIGGKLTYANGNNNIIAGQGNTTTLYTRDAHTIGSGQDFNIYYADQTPGAPSATVVGANNDLVLYTLNSMHIDELGKKTITNFSNNDTVILYDTSRNVLWGSLNSNGSDAALTHTGFTFDIGNTPGNVEGIQVVIGDAFAVGGGYVQNQVNTTFNVAPVLTYTEHEFGAIETLAITNGGTGYKRLPIITVANNFMIGLSNSLEHTGDMNALLNVNLHSYSTGTVTQVGQVLTLSGGTFPDANSNPLHITYANGFEDYVTSVISATSLNMETSTGVPSPETYTLTYGANANNFAANEIIYTDDYESRGIVLDWFDEPGKQTYPRSVGTANEGTYVEKPGQTGYMRRNIVNGNTTLRVDMLTISDFTGVYSYFLEEGSPTSSGFNDKLVFEDGSRIYPEDSITFMLMEDDFIILNEDGDRTFGEDVGSDRITAYDGANSIIYSTGTITQSGNVVTGISGETIFPNELIRGTLTYANNLTTTITGHTNATSITVSDSQTIGSGEVYSISYNPAATYGDNSSVTAVATGTGFRTVIVTEELHTKTKDNKIKIEGAADKIFNGIFSASPIDSNSYSYTISEDFTASQISGNLSSKFVKTAYLDTSNASLMDTSLKGNNAVIEVSSIAAGSIKSVAIENVGAGYSSNPKVLAGDGDNNAQMTAVIGAFAQYPGKYYGTQGRLDDAPKIQDSRYYQSFSYVVKAPIDTTKYRAHVDRLVHPAGMKMFGELAIILKASAELFSSGYHAGTPGLEGPGKPKDVDNYDDSGYEFGRPDYLHLHTPRFHPIILTRQILVNAEIKTDYQPHVEIYTHDVPHHAMDGRIEHRGNVEIKREDFRDVQNMIRSSASMLTYVMDESQGNGEQYEIGETVYQGTSYFTRIREATVAGYNHDSKTLNLINMIPNMDFILDKNIIGYLGGANYGILIEATLPMADITELEHSHETGDIIQITRATTDYFNGEYVIQTVPDTNTYTVFLGRGDPGEGVEAVAQTAYGGSWLKVETKSIANVWRVSSQNYESPFEGTITQEDELIDGVIYNYSITLEEGDTYLLPKIQFPEYDSGTVSIDMSFSSDLLLEEHINPDTGLHEDGYVLHEAHGGQVGMGPTRYISLEDDTEGIEWSYERGHLGHEPLSIPYMETQVTFDVYENAGYSLFLEDGSHLIEEGDETSRPLSRFITEDRHPGLHSTEAEHVLRPVGEIEFEFKENFGWNFLLQDGHTRIISENPHETELFLTEEDYFRPEFGEVEFDLYDSVNQNLMLEDEGTYFIEEGDETASPLARFIILDNHPGLLATEYEHGKRPLGEVEFDLYENAGYSLKLEDDSHFIEEGEETWPVSSPITFIVTVVENPTRFYINGVEQSTLTLTGGKLYRFDQSDSTNNNHPLRFSLTEDGHHEGGVHYTDGVTIVGTAGQSGAYVELQSSNIAETIYYHCHAHPAMGGTANKTTGVSRRTRHRFMIEDSQPGSHSTEAEHVLRPFGDIEFVFDLAHPPFGAPATEALTPPSILGALEGWIQYEDNSDLGLEDGGNLTLDSDKLPSEGSLDEIQFDLYESLYVLYTLEDGSHLIEEGDESTELSRFVMERGPDIKKIPVGEVHLDLEALTPPSILGALEGWIQYEDGSDLGLEDGGNLTLDTDKLPSEGSLDQIIFELPPIEGALALTAAGDVPPPYIQTLVIDRPYFNWHIMTEDDDHLVFEDEDLNVNWGEGRKINIENVIYPNAFYRGSDLLMIDKSGITADNPMRNYKLREARGQVIEVWGERIIGNQNFGCQVGRARGARQKYLDGVNHTGDPLQRGSLGKFGEDRQLDGDAYRQNYGEAGSIISGPGLNMNHPGRIGKFNQYWELMSIHHPIMLTGPAWWNDDIKTPVTIYPTPLVMEDGEEILTEGGETFLLTGWGSSIHVVATHYSPNANTALQGIYVAQDTNRLLPPRNSTISAVHLQLESATSAEGHYFELEEFPGRINLNYNDISMKSAHSAFTTFNGMTGQIEMVGGSTTITGTNTLFTSQLVTNDLIQTHAESVIVEDDEGIVMESNERIEHEDVTLAGLIEYSDDATLGQLDNIQLSEIRWFIATEDTQGHYGNYHVGTGWDQETKTDVPGSYYLVGESSIAEEEIELEINTPNPGGVGNRVVASETVWYQENLIWEDGTRILLTQAAEYRIKTITDDTTLNVHRASLDGTDIVPFWKMATETETTAIVSGLHSQ